MEKKGLDFNFFIGVFLIFGILTWYNSTQIPNEIEVDQVQQVPKDSESIQAAKENNVNLNYSNTQTPVDKANAKTATI